MKDLVVKDVQEVGDLKPPAVEAVVIDGIQWVKPNDEQMLARVLPPFRSLLLPHQREALLRFQHFVPARPPRRVWGE